MSVATIQSLWSPSMKIHVGDRFRYGIFVVSVKDIKTWVNDKTGVPHVYVTFDLANLGSNGTLEGYAVREMIARGDLIPMNPRELLSECTACGAKNTDFDTWIQVLTTINVYEYPRLWFTTDGQVDQFDVRLEEDWNSQETQEVRCGVCLEPLTDEQRRAYEEAIA